MTTEEKVPAVRAGAPDAVRQDSVRGVPCCGDEGVRALRPVRGHVPTANGGWTSVAALVKPDWWPGWMPWLDDVDPNPETTVAILWIDEELAAGEQRRAGSEGA